MGQWDFAARQDRRYSENGGFRLRRRILSSALEVASGGVWARGSASSCGEPSGMLGFATRRLKARAATAPAAWP
jgi:hypothetical protein